MLSELSATCPSTTAGFRQLGQLAKTRDFTTDASAEQHRETAFGRVYMGGLPGKSVGL